MNLSEIGKQLDALKDSMDQMSKQVFDLKKRLEKIEITAKDMREFTEIVKELEGT